MSATENIKQTLTTVNKNNFNTILGLLSVLIMVGVAVIGFEIYSVNKKQRLLTIPEKNFDYVLLEDKFDCVDNDEELGIRDI
jgi:hypothetical protein